MLYAALALAVLALIVALAAHSKAAGFEKTIEDLRADSRRRAENGKAELDQALAQQRQLLAAFARGAKLTPEMIEEGRTWRDAKTDEALELVARGAVRLLDVRTPQETAQGIITGAVLVPLDQLEARVAEISPKGAPLLVYCAGGARSAAACEFLSSHGYAELLNLEGGFSSWRGPITRTK